MQDPRVSIVPWQISIVPSEETPLECTTLLTFEIQDFCRGGNTQYSKKLSICIVCLSSYLFFGSFLLNCNLVYRRFKSSPQRVVYSALRLSLCVMGRIYKRGR